MIAEQMPPAQTNATHTGDRLRYLDLLTVALSLYVLGALMAEAFFDLPREIVRLLHDLDLFICIFFLLDFCVRFYHAPSKLRFMRWGWIDLLASIPALDVFRPARIFRLLQLLRILRAFRGAQHLVDFVFRHKQKGALTSAFVFAVLMIIFSSIAILQVERAPDSNIKTAEDALWWAYVTITTVGYGDRYPVTTEGRIIAVLLMTVGVALFGTFAGYVASWFVEKDEEKRGAEAHQSPTTSNHL